jgi:hypothetical protein
MQPNVIALVHQAATAIPGYCTSGHGILTPSQWSYCAKLGYSEPTTGAANAGFSVGHSGAPVFIAIALAIILLAAMAIARSRKPATQS